MLCCLYFSFLYHTPSPELSLMGHIFVVFHYKGCLMNSKHFLVKYAFFSGGHCLLKASLWLFAWYFYHTEYTVESTLFPFWNNCPKLACFLPVLPCPNSSWIEAPNYFKTAWRDSVSWIGGWDLMYFLVIWSLTWTSRANKVKGIPLSATLTMWEPMFFSRIVLLRF